MTYDEPMPMKDPLTPIESEDLPATAHVPGRPPSDAAPVADGSGPVDISGLPGKLVVLEGTDGAGRSTHVALLREWLETRGYGVAHTGLTRSRLVSGGLKHAKEGHTLARTTMDLFYATDFADRLENQIVPALRAGFVVLTDRYIYSLMARSMVRGGALDWIEDVYRFAPEPHAVVYLTIGVDDLPARVLASGGFDYWESGLDFQEETDVYRSFVRYQTALLGAFDELSAAHRFTRIDATRPVSAVFRDVRDHVMRVVEPAGSPAEA